MISGFCRLVPYGRSPLLLSRFGSSVSPEAVRISSRPFHAGAPVLEEKEGDQHISDMRALHKPDRFDRWIMANYSKKGQYKSTEDVPTRVPKGDMDTAKTRFRIRMSLYMMLVTVLACAYMVYLGKNLGQKESMESINRERHRKWKDEAEKKT